MGASRIFLGMDSCSMNCGGRLASITSRHRSLSVRHIWSRLDENAPGDYYWGCGKDGTGRNQLGLTLMQVRDILASE
jgi:hypothetical protein